MVVRNQWSHFALGNSAASIILSKERRKMCTSESPRNVGSLGSGMDLKERKKKKKEKEYVIIMSP
jgi:hypothetical protein